MPAKEVRGHRRVSRRLEGKGPMTRSVGPMSVPLFFFTTALVFLVIGIVAGGALLGGNFLQLGGSGGRQSPVGPTVVEKNIEFVPANITITVGQTITWVNQDPVAHDVTFQAGFGSGGLGSQAPGTTYSYTFTQPGVYPYRCQVHSSGFNKGDGMVGEVVVTSG